MNKSKEIESKITEDTSVSHQEALIDPFNEYVSIEYKFEDYLRKLHGENHVHSSQPIAIENCIYELYFLPGGWGKGNGAFISLGYRRCLPSLNSNEMPRVDAIYCLKHS